MDSTSFDGRALGEQVIGVVREYVSRKTEELTQRVRALEYALVNYCGEYEAEKTYAAGVVVKHAGGIWRAEYKTASEPGAGGAWARLLAGPLETAS
jgi:hypothetical protein